MKQVAYAKPSALSSEASQVLETARPLRETTFSACRPFKTRACRHARHRMLAARMPGRRPAAAERGGASGGPEGEGARLLLRKSGEQALAGEELDHDHGKAIHIRSSRHFARLQQLRCHVGRRACSDTPRKRHITACTPSSLQLAADACPALRSLAQKFLDNQPVPPQGQIASWCISTAKQPRRAACSP